MNYLFSEGCKIGEAFLTAYIVQTFSAVSDAFMYNKNAQTNKAEVPEFSCLQNVLINIKVILKNVIN